MTRVNRREAMGLIGAGLVGMWSSSRSSAAAVRNARAEASDDIIKRPIPSTGEQLPVIGLGTSGTFEVDEPERGRQSLKDVLATFSKLGGTVVDTSPMYGDAETVVGALAADLGLSGKLFLATKVWTSGRGRGIDQMTRSMRRLRSTRLDLIQVHNLVDVGTQLDVLREWKQQGRVRYIGVTHYEVSHHDELAKLIASTPVDFIQVNYSVGEREAERRLLPLARERGVAVLANRPFARGALLRRMVSTPLPEWAGEIGCTTWAQLMLKFVISHPAVTCAIPATSKVQHLSENMAAGVGPLPEEHMRALIAAAAA